MLEQLVTGTSKSIIFAGKELSKGIVTAKAELNPQFIKAQAGARAKFELMKAQYQKVNGTQTASIDMQANKMFQDWLNGEKAQQEMAEAMMREFTAAPKAETPKMYTAEEVQQMLAQLQAQQKDQQAV